VAKVGFPAILHCQPAAAGGIVRWTHNRVQIATSQNDSCNCKQLQNNSLVINVVTERHEGIYTCFLLQRLGTKNVSGSLVVAGK